jgi:hypothetical protein
MIRPACLAAAFLAAMAAGIALPASATVLYSTNFASPTFTTGALAGQAGWGVFSADGEATVQNTITDGGEPAVDLGSETSAYYQYGPVTPTDPIVVSMDIYDTTSGAIVNFAAISSSAAFDDDDFLEDRAAGVQIQNYVSAIAGASPELASVPSHTWFNVSMTLDYATQTYDISVDGAVLASNIPFCGYEPNSNTCTGAQASQFEGVELSQPNGIKGGAIYFGDVSIVELPEPSAWTMMLAGFAFAGLGLRSRRRLAA